MSSPERDPQEGAFAGRMRCTRTRVHTNEYGRRILAARAGPA